jgi:DNA-binding NarL/FixJ family response regulator
MTSLKTSQRIGVFCVDDNPLVAEALRSKFASEADIRWLGHQESAEDVVARVQSCKPDILLLDLDIPGPEAVDALRDLTRFAPHVRVIVLSGHVSLEFVNKTIMAGSWGYVSKGDGEAAVLAAIRSVMADEFYLSAEALNEVGQARRG